MQFYVMAVVIFKKLKVMSPIITAVKLIGFWDLVLTQEDFFYCNPFYEKILEKPS